MGNIEIYIPGSSTPASSNPDLVIEVVNYHSKIIKVIIDK